MKKILIVCLLGIGLLLPSTTITAKEFSKKIIDVYLEGPVLIAVSDANTGSISQINIFDSHEHKVIGQSCGGYECEVDLSSLPSGTYRAHVTTTLSNYNEVFTL